MKRTRDNNTDSLSLELVPDVWHVIMLHLDPIFVGTTLYNVNTYFRELVMGARIWFLYVHGNLDVRESVVRPAPMDGMHIYGITPVTGERHIDFHSSIIPIYAWSKGDLESLAHFLVCHLLTLNIWEEDLESYHRSPLLGLVRNTIQIRQCSIRELSDFTAPTLWVLSETFFHFWQTAIDNYMVIPILRRFEASFQLLSDFEQLYRQLGESIRNVYCGIYTATFDQFMEKMLDEIMWKRMRVHEAMVDKILSLRTNKRLGWKDNWDEWMIIMLKYLSPRLIMDIGYSGNPHAYRSGDKDVVMVKITIEEKIRENYVNIHGFPNLAPEEQLPEMIGFKFKA